MKKLGSSQELESYAAVSGLASQKLHGIDAENSEATWEVVDARELSFGWKTIFNWFNIPTRGRFVFYFNKVRGPMNHITKGFKWELPLYIYMGETWPFNIRILPPRLFISSISNVKVTCFNVKNKNWILFVVCTVYSQARWLISYIYFYGSFI